MAADKVYVLKVYVPFLTPNKRHFPTVSKKAPIVSKTAKIVSELRTEIYPVQNC